MVITNVDICVCRYHYNVSPDRLDVHVKKGWQDRLSITSVGSCQGLWALIMDSNPGYVSQVLPDPRPICSAVFREKWLFDARQKKG